MHRLGMNAEVFTFVNFGEVLTVGDAVEHGLRVVAVRVQFGAQTDSVGDDARVLARDGARLF